MSLFEDSNEETEEERKERQTQNAAAAAGLAIGAAVALTQHVLQKNNEIYEAEPLEEESQDFEQTM